MMCSICHKQEHRASSCPRRVRLAVAFLAFLTLTGCGTVKEVVIGVDSFCQLPKRKWSVGDTPETIRDIRVWNAAHDKRCAKTS